MYVVYKVIAVLFWIYREIKSSLDMIITAKQLDEALAFVNKKYTMNGVHFEIAREKYHEETLRIFKEAFFVDEPISKSLQLEWSADVESFITDIIKENISLIAVDDTTGEVIGIRISAPTSSTKEAAFDPSVFKDEKLIKLFMFLGVVAQKTDFYNRYSVSEAIEFFALATVRKYRQRGLGTQLMAGAVDLFKYLKLENMYIKSVGTSNYSQKIFEKVGFATVCQVEYKDYTVNGEVVLNNTGAHTKSVAYVIKT